MTRVKKAIENNNDGVIIKQVEKNVTETKKVEKIKSKGPEFKDFTIDVIKFKDGFFYEDVKYKGARIVWYTINDPRLDKIRDTAFRAKRSLDDYIKKLLEKFNAKLVDVDMTKEEYEGYKFMAEKLFNKEDKIFDVKETKIVCSLKRFIDEFMRDNKDFLNLLSKKDFEDFYNKIKSNCGNDKIKRFYEEGVEMHRKYALELFSSFFPKKQ